MFLVMKIKKYPVCVSNNTFKRHIDLLLVVEEDKRHYVLTKYFNTCMYDHTLHQLIYANFESILVQNSNEFYTNKYQKYVACSYVYKLACVDHKFSKLFKSYFKAYSRK